MEKLQNGAVQLLCRNQHLLSSPTLSIFIGTSQAVSIVIYDSRR